MEATEFSSVVDSLMTMFGDVISRDVIITIVESCGGDLSISADAIMRIIGDTNSVDDNASSNSKSHDSKEEKQSEQSHDRKEVKQPENATQNIASTPVIAAPVSYAAAFQRTGAVPKQQIKPTQSLSTPTGWTEQFARIVTYHNQGYRTLILMRGAPGSGKTFLASRIIEATIGASFADLKTHICSTDDFFVVAGRYNFNRHELPYAHSWNQKRSFAAMEQGLSPVIIDNTNIELWEMEPYARIGVANGYIIEVVEPNTPWARKPNQLLRRNIHNVPITSIKRMLDNLSENITGDSLLKKLGLSYPADKVPPVIRSMPVFQPNLQMLTPATMDVLASQDEQTESTATINEEQQEMEFLDTNAVANLSLKDSQIVQPIRTQEVAAIIDVDNDAVTVSDSIPAASHSSKDAVQIGSSDDENKEDEKIRLYVEVQKQLEEIERVEQEWESGENWHEEDTSGSQSRFNENKEDITPKPQRQTQSQPPSDEKLIENINHYQDWRQISMFMTPWDAQEASSSKSNKPVVIPVERVTSSTCMEMGDINNYNNMLKVLTATPRDINEFNVSFNREKIPEKRMLDKSTMTNETIIIDSTRRCQSEEKHFKEFRKLFKHVSKNALRDIFDKCLGDVNWAVEIVLDGVASKQLETVDNVDVSDEEENTCGGDDQCSCLDAYHILPDQSVSHPSLASIQTDERSLSEASGTSPKLQNQKKTRKETNTSENSMILKRLIENNVGFSENHYSQHCLKIRKFRRGENEVNDETNNERTIDTNINETGYQDTASCLSNDDESNISVDDIEKTVVLNLGRDFVTELDRLFGRRDMTYPDKVLPKINIPLSLLNEINALWMESLMYQLDEHDKQSAIMLQEDEELARQLSLKEAELASTGKEPEVPDFKEIMDMDLALSLYQKDVAEWRNKEPNDLAAKLTREKLYNLFPDVPNEILSELLMAHDNNFQNTVEVLLMSTGKAEILEQKNGLNKFVMEKEMERQERILEEEKKALSEVEWPLLPRGETVDMSVVNSFREKAERHLVSRNMNHQKANDYVRRGMLQAATHYSEMAAYHKQMYEQASSLAAVSLMQVHATNSPDSATIDLHYLRVAEAKEALDLFIDTHIHKLKENQGRGVRHHTLFFITGRGLHSNGRPRVKPAVKHRLRERGLAFSERNPGLLTARVCAEDKLTYQLA